MKPIIAWLLAASLAWLPVPKLGQPGPFGRTALNGETPGAYLARRQAIVEDIGAVAFDASERPLFDGPTARAETALLLDSIARFESAYDLRVDTGEQRGPAGEVCILQVLVDAQRLPGVGMVTAEGWTARELATDRRKCIRAALHKLAVSRAICSDARHPLNASHKALVGADAFTLYTSGKCSEGSPAAAHRYDLARRWLAGHPAPSSSSSSSASASPSPSETQ